MRDNKSKIGYIGLACLIVSYCFLISPFPNVFLILNLISCIILFIHSVEIRDKPFLFVNAFASIVLFLKFMSGGIN